MWAKSHEWKHYWQPFWRRRATDINGTPLDQPVIMRRFIKGEWQYRALDEDEDQDLRSRMAY